MDTESIIEIRTEPEILPNHNETFYRDVQGMKTVGSEWNSNTVNSPSTDNCTVTFYLSWRHISVVKAAKLDLAAFTAWSQGEQF
jgi:hypothetical protein